MSKSIQLFLHKNWQKNKKIRMNYLLSFGVLVLGFVICRYAVFGVIHGMKSWPVDLFVVGIVALLLSMIAGKCYVPWFISLGYSLGFWAGALFHTEGYDPGGGKTDNLWIIWTVVFLGCILAGVVVEIVIKWRKLFKRN